MVLNPSLHGCQAIFLVNTYREARESKTVLRLEASLTRLDVIAIDELGYLPIDRAGAENLFGFLVDAMNKQA